MPGTKKAISLDSLNRANESYQNVIKTLPYIALQEVAAALKLNILYVNGTDKIVSRRRSSGFARPYFAGCSAEEKKELLKFVEMELKPELVFAAIYDNVTNYTEKKVLTNAGEKLDNKTKKHPQEYAIIKAAVESYMEDVISALYFGQRDTTKKTPMASFNGFFTVLNLLKTAGYISAAEGNLQTTGALSVPSGDTVNTDTSAYDTLVEFISNANPLLKLGAVQLTCAQSVIRAAKKAYKNKCKSFADPKTKDFIEALRDDAEVPGLEICTHPCLGTGSKLMLHKAGLFDLGRADGNGSEFCQVRNPSVDPNEVQFWIQDGFGTRIQDIHAKLFCTNEQANTSPVNLYGDYTPSEGDAV